MSKTSESKLSTEQLMLVEARVSNEKKSAGVAYALLLFLGTFGAHNFYLGRIADGIFKIILFVVGVTGLLVFVGGAMSESFEVGLNGGIAWLAAMMILGLSLLIDLFTIPKTIRKDMDKNRQLIIGQMTEKTPTVLKVDLANLYTSLKSLGDLRASGVLSDAEFKKEKDRLLKAQSPQTLANISAPKDQ